MSQKPPSFMKIASLAGVCHGESKDPAHSMLYKLVLDLATRCDILRAELEEASKRASAFENAMGWHNYGD